MIAMLVFARCAGFIFRAPGFSHPSVPSPVRAALALFLAVAIAPSVNKAAIVLDSSAFIVAFIVEFLIGSAIGMAASLVYDGAYSGGRAVDDYVGVKAIAPSLQLVAPSGFGRIWSLAFTGSYFLSGAYRLTLLAFAQSFASLPPGAPVQPHSWLAFAATYASAIANVALQVAAPAIGLAFVVQIAVGAISRAVPRFGSFTLAFPLALAAALVATAIAAPLIAQHAPRPLLAIPGAPR
jgi:flagellar biosynthesis protein FliR